MSRSRFYTVHSDNLIQQRQHLLLLLLISPPTHPPRRLHNAKPPILRTPYANTLRHLPHLHHARIRRRNTHRLGRLDIRPTAPSPIPRFDSSMVCGRDNKDKDAEGEEAAEHDAADDAVGQRGFGVVVRFGPGVGGGGRGDGSG